MDVLNLPSVFNRQSIQGYEDEGIVTAVYADGGFQFSKGEVVELKEMEVKHQGFKYVLVTRIVPDSKHYKWCCLETGVMKELEEFIV